jgi:hypothetical protein
MFPIRERVANRYVYEFLRYSASFAFLAANPMLRIKITPFKLKCGLSFSLCVFRHFVQLVPNLDKNAFSGLKFVFAGTASVLEDRRDVRIAAAVCVGSSS